MSFRARFLLLAVFNCALVIAFLWLPSYYQLDLSQRLVDLQLNTSKGLLTFSLFLGGMAVGFFVNFLLMTSRKSEFTYDQVAQLLHAARNSA